MKIATGRDIALMKERIRALDSTEGFYDKVRKIVGFYDGVFIQDWDIKELERISDARFEELERDGK